jgi:hypothetical protein
MKPTRCVETGIDCLNSYQLLNMFFAACKMEGASLARQSAQITGEENRSIQGAYLAVRISQ